MSKLRGIYCCGCIANINARLTDGSEIYPHRHDLANRPFWICDKCQNYVGCHYKTKDSTKPLGCIPTREIRVARSFIHGVIDPICKNGKISRGRLYDRMRVALGYPYHTAEIKSIEQARDVYRAAKKIEREFT